MTVFSSDHFQISETNEKISEFLSDPKNLIQILPAERIENWVADDITCSFKIKGLAAISLLRETANASEVVFDSNSEKPFPFKLIIELKQNSGGTELSARFNAEVNAFMGTMLKGPLTNFLNHLGEEIKAKYSQA